MKLKRTKANIVLKLSHKEFDTLWAAVESIGCHADGGAYKDVTVFMNNLSAAYNRLENYNNNVWVAPGLKAFIKRRTE